MAGSGYRGYIASRPIMGERIPQHVQNLVLRDYAGRRGLTLLLPAAEYAMPGCHMILEQVVDELAGLDGIVAYSLFMLPDQPAARESLWRRVRGAGGAIHFALEGLAMADDDGFFRIEDIRLARRCLDSGASAPAAMLADWLGHD